MPPFNGAGLSYHQMNVTFAAKGQKVNIFGVAGHPGFASAAVPGYHWAKVAVQMHTKA